MTELYNIDNMKVNMERNFDNHVFQTIKTGIGCPAKVAWSKISYKNFCKLSKLAKS